MRPVEMHPEHLIDRARDGLLAKDDAALLRDHVQRCSACRLELQLVRDYEASPLEAVSSEAVERVMGGALARMDWRSESGERPAVTTRPPKAGSNQLLFRLAAAAVFLVATTGIATAYVLLRKTNTEVGPVAVKEPEPARSAGSRELTPVQLPAVEIESEGTASATRSRRTTRRSSSDIAEALLNRASEARKQKQFPQAIRLYRQLQQRFPQSRQARVSHVAMGRVLLDHAHHPRRALRQFERYLRAPGDGSLALEARVGKALALKRLGRREKERAAWMDLLRHHPKSLHAEQARERVRELSAP